MLGFGWLQKFFGRDEGHTPDGRGHVLDSWDGSNGYYVHDFRGELDGIAEALGANVRTRFNLPLGCAELYNEWGVIARIKVHGGECLPYEAVITSPAPLPSATAALFWKAIPLDLKFESAV